MATKKLLLELGIEELPASYVEPALKDFAQKLKQTLITQRLGSEETLSIETAATPRRLAVGVRGLESQQSAFEEEIFGPPIKASKDSDGNWTKAALGFAKKNGVPVESLQTATDPKGVEKLYVKQSLSQDSLENVLTQLLPELISSIKTPKSMRFIPFKHFRFARPLRWIVALSDDHVIPVNIDGIESGRNTHGHRFLSNNARIDLKDADFEHYVQSLKDHYVLVNIEERRATITNLLETTMNQYCTNPNQEETLDQALIDTVNNCVEWPGIVVGEFDTSFLKIPSIVPMTSMKYHQKYFPIIDAEKGLQAQFLSITNGTGQDKYIKAGNERVIAARLADAVFFWEEDQKISLSKRYDDLKSMLYQKDIGSYWDKTESTRAIGEDLAGQLNWIPEQTALVDRAIKFSKIDLITHMVYEFPELQGFMGGEYLALEHEHADVIQAVTQQYDLESTGHDLSDLLILADRLDTLISAFRIGTKVTGSSDPYGLRRAGVTIVNILHARQWGIEISDEILIQFLKERIKSFAQDSLKIRYDVVDAVLSKVVDTLNISDVLQRMKSIQNALQSSDSFSDVLTLCGRVLNILDQAKHKSIPILDSIRTELCQESSEHTLVNAYGQIENQIKDHLEQGRYSEVLDLIATLKPDLDAFFEQVMVMAEDETIRANRLAILQAIANTCSPLADFSKIVESKGVKS